MRRLLLTAGAALAIAMATTPVALQASDDLSSSMTAFCVDSGCSRVQFTLDVEGSVFLSNLILQSLDATLWKFGGLHKVFDAGWNDVTDYWSAGVHPITHLVLAANTATFSAEPVHFVVNMVQPPNGTQSDLAYNIAYAGNGFQEMGSNGTGSGYFSTGGVVTPEPTTSLLLGTGLLALGVGVMRRRRNGLEEEGRGG